MVWDQGFRGLDQPGAPAFRNAAPLRLLYRRLAARFLFTCYLLLFSFAATGISSCAREKNNLQYGEGLIVNIPLPEPEVAQAVEEASQNTIIRGTKEYNKDEYVAGAVAATSTPVFAPWTDTGKVFYKVRRQALDPVNFKDSSDVGTLAVRYVVQPQGDKNTVLRIDALFVEDFRHRIHPSNGSVESAEYKDIQDRLASVELVKKETAEALLEKKEKQERLSRKNFSVSRDNSDDQNSDRVFLSTPAATEPATERGNGESPSVDAANRQNAPASALPKQTEWDPSAETLQQHVAELRRQVERLVMKPGAPLKSAPFHSASTLKSLEAGTEVLLLITTPYWYGVETRDGQHGWIRRDQLEQVP